MSDATVQACDLASQTCEPCRGGISPLKGEALSRFAQALPAWAVINAHHLERRFDFKDFAGGLAFVNRVGALAEAEGHHPDLALSWGKVVVTLYTHEIDGLAENDFVLAAKIDALPPG